MTSKPFDQASALRIIGSTAKKFDISLETLRAEFPNRPTSEAEFRNIAKWMQSVWESRQGEQNVDPINPPHSSSQAKPQGSAWDVPAGNYAYEYNGKTHFYRVSKKEGQGKWAGRTFTKVQERASDDLFQVDRKRGYAILCRILEEGIEASGLLFAQRLGRCYRCGKSLTDESNPYKEQGLGPECGTK